ncbi:Uu.00g026750.m01.CDS01 [Anthostomella pinea]|uniref:D-xylose 1-dehydrogenase (NADP(+), D-xylono-1,5-lactone-forming) n=1 Tax=Anthostomella pinea TaxID=933095 RepID=A0AAI8V837_9PEZI|nr:Uu.00g026750.m01.CDS01 [Anthostomella pinea]
MAKLPTCRWGIITTGLISSWFVADLVLPRPDAKAHHIIQAIGASSLRKSQAFADTHLKDTPHHKPALYGSYAEVCADASVDCVYIGSPHGVHARDCLAAIAAGKNVLCEKAFAINASEARSVFDAARRAGVYVAEAMWLRHRPLVADLRKLLYEEKVIGDVFRATSDFQMYVDMKNAPATSRYRDLELGAGSLLDIGIYPLTWALLMLDSKLPGDGNGEGEGEGETPRIMAAQSFVEGIEVTTSIVLHYASSGRQGVVTSTTERKKGASQIVATIDGTDGFVEVEGGAPSHPKSFTVYPKWTGDEKPQGKRYDYESAQQGFIYEADNTALDLAAGRKESAVMPWSETIRVMEIMDEVRRQGGCVYPRERV